MFKKFVMNELAPIRNWITKKLGGKVTKLDAFLGLLIPVACLLGLCHWDVFLVEVAAIVGCFVMKRYKAYCAKNPDDKEPSDKGTTAKGTAASKGK